MLNSGHVTEALCEQALQNDTHAVLSKPTDFSEFVRTIKAALGRHQHIFLNGDRSIGKSLESPWRNAELSRASFKELMPDE